jgi:ribokinase
MKALTVGSAMIDTIAIVDSRHIERMSMRNADSAFLLLEEGRKTEADEVSTHTGGGAVNAAIAMARLGLDVGVLAKIGIDARAEVILDRLKWEHVSTTRLKRDGRLPTGASVLISSHDRNAAIFTFRGANTLLQKEDIDDQAFAVDIVYVANLSNESADCFPDIVKRAKARNALVAANPGPRQLSARGQAFFESLPAVDVLVLNQSEADLLVPRLVARWGEGGPPLAGPPGDKVPPLAARGLVSGGFEMSLVAYMHAFLELGPKYIVITDGERGTFVGSHEEIVFAPAYAATVLSTAGAGDAFGSTFTAFLALGYRRDEALAAATINSSSVVGHVDTQSGLLRREDLDQKLAVELTAIRRWPMQKVEV